MALYLDRLLGVRQNSLGSYPIASGSRSNTALNAAFVNGTSGNAVAVRYMANTTDPIDELYLFLDTITGTRGNITMAAKIYNENAFAARTGSTERDASTATSMPASDDQWIKFTFGTPYTPAIGEILWLVAYNTAADPATDYPHILTSISTAAGGVTGGVGNMAGYTTTAGFSANGSAAGKLPFVIKQGSNYFGQPFTQRATVYSSNQLERGIVITPSEDVVVTGVVFEGGNVAAALIRILADATAPGGTALYEYDLDSDTNQTTNDVCNAKVFSTPVTLSGGTTYKVTMTFSANATIPSGAQIEDYSSYSSMFDTLREYDTMFQPWSAIDNGAGGWTIDKAFLPAITLIVRDYPAISGGSGGGIKLAGRGGLAG